MHTKTMEGLAGASVNMKLMNTPFRIYKDAERRGDTAVMERAMGYVGEFADKAGDYQKKAKEGMKEEAEEAREKAEAEQEDAIRKRKEQRGELKKRMAERDNEDTDSVSIRESEKADVVKAASVIYTKTGEASKPESGSGMNISVSL